MLEATRYILEFDVTMEVKMQPNTVDLDSDHESLSFMEQWRLQTVSPGTKKKQTYKAIDKKTPVQTPNWKAIAMTSFDFEDNPFQWIWEEVDQLQGQYSKLEYIIKRAVSS